MTTLCSDFCLAEKLNSHTNFRFHCFKSHQCNVPLLHSYLEQEFSSISASAASAHQQQQCISSISTSVASAQQQKQWISSIGILAPSVTCTGRDICPYTYKKRRLEFLSRKKTVSSPGALLPVATFSLASPRADPHSPVTPGAEIAFQKDALAINRSESHLCICGALPCVCLACHPLSPKDDHHVPKVKLRKSASGWTSTSSGDRPGTPSPILSNAPVCQNCNHAFLDPSHQCENDKEDNLSTQSKDMSREVWEDSDTLDLQACKDLALSDLHTSDEKFSILQKNCISILKKEPIDIPTARYCFSLAQYFKSLRDNVTFGYSMDHLVNKVFNPQFDQEISKHGL